MSWSDRPDTEGEDVISKSLRDATDFHPGDDVEFSVLKGQIVLRVVRRTTSLGGRFRGSGMARQLLDERRREPR